MVRIKLAGSLMACPIYWQNYVQSLPQWEWSKLNAFEEHDAREKHIEADMAQIGGRFEKETRRSRTRRPNGRWVYFNTVFEYLVFDRDEDAIMFKMRWS